MKSEPVLGVASGFGCIGLASIPRGWSGDWADVQTHHLVAPHEAHGGYAARLQWALMRARQVHEWFTARGPGPVWLEEPVAAGGRTTHVELSSLAVGELLRNGCGIRVLAPGEVGSVLLGGAAHTVEGVLAELRRRGAPAALCPSELLAVAAANAGMARQTLRVPDQEEAAG